MILVGMMILNFTGCIVEETQYLTYESDSLGLSFEYPASEGAIISEDLNADQNGETGTVTIFVPNGNTTILSVEWIDSPTETDNMAEHLQVILLDNSEYCKITEKSITTEKETYNFSTLVSPYEDSNSDPNCQILSEIYYFPAQANKVVIVGSGQTPPFTETEYTEHFYDSIELFE